MKKILFINTLYSPHIRGGAEIIFQEQVESFKNKGYGVAVLTTKSGNREINTAIVNGVKVYRAGIKNIYWHFTTNKPNRYIRMLWHLNDIYNAGMRKYVKKVIDIEKPDVVICHNLTGFSISIWDEIKAARLPVIQVLHDLYLMCPNSNMFKNGQTCDKQCRICRLMRRKHPQKSECIDAVVGVSAYVLNRLKANDYFKNVPSYVIYNAREISEPSKHLLWNGKGTLRLGYIGTLSRVKGIEWLITQFMSLDIDATLTIAGRGESAKYEKYLKELASGDKRIRFSGYVKSTDHYANIHVSVIPSQWADTFPTVAFESCACHVPVIATTMGGLPEIIKDNVNGWLCDANNQNSLGQKILEVYNSPELISSCSKHSRESVRSFLDIDRLTNEYEDVYKKTLRTITV
jgi:glycosyltransferase involved in cell wall biosynthesis